MRHGNLMLVASLTVSTLTGCGNDALAPGANGESVALKQQESPTVATRMGPFEGVSGCAIEEFSVYYWSAAYDVNADGIAVGNTHCVAAELLLFRWSELQGMEQLANFAGGYPIVSSESINKSGNIAAWFFGAVGFPLTRSRPVLWTAANSRIELVPVTTCDPPDQSCGPNEGVSYINDNDVVVGWYDGPYRWTAETGLVYLPVSGAPSNINSHGDFLAGGFLVRKSGVLVDFSGIAPTSMNDKREIVGIALNGGSADAAIWRHGKGVELLGTVGGTSSVAYDINNRGEVVGASTNMAGEMRAFYWTKSRGMVDLGPGIAYAISDEGHMVGIAPTGLFPPDQEEPLQELWQATLWRGTAGVPPTAAAVRGGATPNARASNCLDDESNWQSKSRMSKCIAER